MPLPLIPLAITAIGGLVTGAFIAGDNKDAQVIINPPNELRMNVQTAALLAGTALAAVVIIPKVLEK